MTTAKQMKEGCRRNWNWHGENIMCGCKDKDDSYLCPECKARLSQYKSDLQQELATLNKIGKSYKIGGLALFYVQERIKEIKKELKEIEV